MSRAAAVALLLLGLGCAGADEVVTGPTGVGERFRIAAPDDAVLVGPAGDRAPRRLSVRVQALAGSAAATGLDVRFDVRTGRGRLASTSARTGEEGVASVDFEPPGGVDSTVVRAWLPGDPGAAIDLALLSRPVIALSARPGDVAAVPDAAAGVLLRIPEGLTVDLVAFSSSSGRGGLEYELRRDIGIHAGETSEARAPEPLHPAAAGMPAAPSPRPGQPGFEPLDGSGIPAEMDVRNCLLDEHRRAPLAWLAEGVALYLDETAVVDSAWLREIGRAYDAEVFPRVSGLFGPPLDLDRNVRVLAVMSPAMPDNAGVFCGSVRRVNREIVYLPWNADLGLGVHVGLLAHELQHLINASQHYRNGGTAAPSDVIWLNEGFSLVAEWQAGYPHNPLRRTFAFLARANGGLPLLGERYDRRYLGGWFLFALYLRDRFGPDVYRSLGESGLTGRANVERVTGVPFRDLLRDWFVTLALADDARADPAWRLSSIVLSGEEERIAACGCVSGARLPGLTLEELPALGPLRILRTLETQDAHFFRLPPRGRPVTLYFQAGGNPDVELVVIHRR